MWQTWLGFSDWLENQSQNWILMTEPMTTHKIDHKQGLAQAIKADHMQGCLP